MSFVEGILNPSTSDVAAQEQGPKEDFFLSPDEAISLGDVEYMRTPKTVRRTFPNVKDLDKPLEAVTTVTAKTKESGEVAAEKAAAVKKAETDVKIDVSLAVKEKKEAPALVMPPMAAMTTGKLQPLVSPSMSKDVSLRRSKDSSLDSFRKMARDLRK